MALAASENWKSGSRECLRYCGRKSGLNAAPFQLSTSEFPPGEGLSALFTHLDLVRGRHLHGGSQTIFRIIPASRRQATGKPSKKS